MGKSTVGTQRDGSRLTQRCWGRVARDCRRRGPASERLGEFLAKQPLCRRADGAPRFGNRGGGGGDESQLLATLFLFRNRFCFALAGTRSHGMQRSCREASERHG